MSTIEWKGNKVKIIDQTLLPGKLVYLDIGNLKDLWKAVRLLKVRGAPALGVAGALGVYLGIKDTKASDFSRFSDELNKVCAYLASCRPTARNLFWGIQRMRSCAQRHKDKPVAEIKKLLLSEAQLIIAEDKRSCRLIAQYGSRLICDNDTIMTICNAGMLATLGCGTALGVIYQAKKEGKRLKVYVLETRPLLQGMRLSAWELLKNKIEARVIPDAASASLMRNGKIDKVIAGADRIASNGDSANKIGTYNLAVLAGYHKIPFYIAAPFSTFDLSIKSGKDIVIEERPKEEVTELLFKRKVAPEDVKVFNPAFDVTPHELITAFITDRGIKRGQIIKPGSELKF